MRTLSLAWLLALAACSGSTPAADDTDVADTELPPVDGPPIDYVATSFHVAEAEQGFDLDGNDTPDNAVAGLALALDPLIASRLAGNVHVVLVQLGLLADLAHDDAVRVGLFPAVDLDNDGTDNASGDEPFDATGFVDADGLALEGATTSVDAGAYRVAIPTTSFQVGSLVFAIATGVHVDATATATTQTGRVGIGVTKDALDAALTGEGVDPTIIGMIQGLADLDLDHDGTPETVSMAFTFDATVCRLATPAEIDAP